MKFKSFLTEIFDTPLPYLVDYENVHGAKYVFHTDTNSYVISISNIYTDDNADRHYDIQFSVRKQHPLNGTSFLSYNRKDADGQELKIYSTVIKATVQYFKKFPLQPHVYAMFSGHHGPKQHAIYDRIAKKFEQELDWISTTHEKNLGKYYMFVPKDRYKI